MRAAGLSRRKVATLRAVAAEFADGSLSDAALRGLDDEKILDRLPSEQEVLRLAEPWRPYRSLATAYLFQSAFEPGGTGANGG